MWRLAAGYEGSAELGVAWRSARWSGFHNLRAARQSRAVGGGNPMVLPAQIAADLGFKYWGEVFKPTSDTVAALGTSVLIASITVVVCLLLAVPAGYALGRAQLPGRRLILLLLLLPQAFPNIAIYFNIARLFYTVGLNGTIAGVVLVHAVHGLVIAVWIAAAAFAAVDGELEFAARNLGASALRTALTITLPLAAPGLMASAIFVFLESLDEFTGTYFVGVPDVTTL